MSDPRGVRIVLGAAAAACAVALLDLVLAAGGALATEDLFWHIATGRELWSSGMPEGDPFAYTTTAPWALHEWAFQIVAAAVHGGAGGWGLRLFGTLLWAGVFAALAWGTRRVTRGHAAWLFTMAIALVLLRHRVQVRPQAFSVLGVALLLPALGDPEWRWTRNRLIALGLGMAAWINIHSVALLAPILLAAAAAGDLCARNARWKASALAAGVAAAATLVSPQPLGPWKYAFAARDPVLAFVTDEWTPLWTGPGAGLSTLAYAALAAAAGVWLIGLLLPLTSVSPTASDPPPQEPSGWSARLPALLSFAAAVPARRFAWLTLLPAADGMRRLAARCVTGAARYVPPALALAAALLAAVDSLPSWGDRFAGPPAQPGSVHAKFPVAAVDLLERAQVSGNCFTAYGDAGYLLHRCAPRLRVFVDGRTLQYDAAVLDEYLRIRDGAPNRDSILLRRGTDLVLATRGVRRPLSTRYWTLVHRDERAQLWVRNERRDLIQALEAAKR